MFLRTIILFLGLLATTLGFASDVPKLTGRVVDTAGILAPQEIINITNTIRTLEAKTGGQIAVCIEAQLPETTSLEERSHAIASTWAIGHKGHDNGALLYMAMKNRAFRLEIGYGWEAWVNDARAGDILRSMIPYLRKNKFADAITLAISHVAHFVEEKIPAPAQQKGISNTAAGILALGFFILMGLYVWSLNERQRNRFIFLLIIHDLVQMILLALLHGNGRGGSGRGGFGGNNFGGGGGGFGGGGASGRW